MTKKIIIIVLIPSLLIYLTGCYSMRDISKEDLQKSQDSKLLVTTNNGDSFHFWKYSYKIRQDTLFGKLYIEN